MRTGPGEAGGRERLRGARRAGCFGALGAGPPEPFDSGVGWDLPLSTAVGAVAGGVVGFVFPSVLSRRRQNRPARPAPPHPPPERRG